MPSPCDGPGTFRLFAYGTLKRGGVRHGPLAAQRFLGEARTAPGYALLDLGSYPGLVRGSAGERVRGEVFEVDCSLLGWLDEEEGAPELFRLEPIEIAGQDNVVWGYFYQGNPACKPRVASGVWENG